MKCQILFSRKNTKNNISLSSAESVHSMLSVKDSIPSNFFFDKISFEYITLSLCNKHYNFSLSLFLTIVWQSESENSNL